jgi:hypothetical protein
MRGGLSGLLSAGMEGLGSLRKTFEQRALNEKVAPSESGLQE